MKSLHLMSSHITWAFHYHCAPHLRDLGTARREGPGQAGLVGAAGTVAGPGLEYMACHKRPVFLTCPLQAAFASSTFFTFYFILQLLRDLSINPQLNYGTLYSRFR